jgi:hypothetical protein
MNTMFQRVRRVIWEKSPGHPTWQQADEIARAVIAELREPTNKMLNAANLSSDKLDGQRLDTIDTWHEMIDAALDQARGAGS